MKSLSILHVNERSVVEGGREAHIRRFSELSDAAGNHNLIVDAEDVAPQLRDGAAPAAALGGSDVAILHGRGSWPLAKEISSVVPTLAWVHDYAFHCPATISWFRNTQETCNLPLGFHCIANAYLKFCNARDPRRNINNYMATRDSLGSVPYLRGIIVASEYVKRRMAIAGVPEELIHVLPYFLVADPAEEAGRSDEQPGRVLYVGRLTEVKGLDLLVDAMPLLPAGSELHIVGGGYYREALEARLSRLDLGDRQVVFRGQVTDPRELAGIYRSAAVVVMPSLWPEPFGIVGLEAMAYARPVVAFDVGGIGEWLIDGQVGLMARPGDVVDLAARIAELLADAERRAALGRRGRELVAERFSWPAHWAGFETILRSCGLAV